MTSPNGDDRSGRSRTLGTRIVGVCTFNTDVYDDIDSDEFAQFQSLQIVLMATISVLFGLIVGGEAVALAGAIVVGLRWYAVSEVMARLGREWYPDRAAEYTRRRAMRLIGYSHAPLLPALFLLVPIVGPVLWVVINLWSLASMALGIRVILHGVELQRVAWILVVVAIPQIVLLALTF